MLYFVQKFMVSLHLVFEHMSLINSSECFCFLCLFKVLTWDVGKITPQKLPSLKGLVNLQSGAPKPEENPSLNIQFKIQQLAISGKEKFDLCLRVIEFC